MKKISIFAFALVALAAGAFAVKANAYVAGTDGGRYCHYQNIVKQGHPTCQWITYPNGTSKFLGCHSTHYTVRTLVCTQKNVR